MEKELIQSYTRRISQANASEIVVIVFELMDIYLKDGITAFENKDMDSFESNLKAALNCLQDLMDSLDFTYELANPLMKIYSYARKEITLSMILRKTGNIETIRKLMSELKGSFEELAKKDASSAVMSNAQSVYAGLTYGRGSLNESINDPSGNRGFKA